jgi:hypothetical protein
LANAGRQSFNTLYFYALKEVIEVKIVKMLGLLSLMSLVACGPATDSPYMDKLKTTGPTNSTSTIIKNNVPLMDADHKTRFDELPLEGNVDISKRLWSGDLWPLNQGLINRRWNSFKQEGFNTISPTREEALVMTEAEISRLAPSEKFDLLMGQYEYPLKEEVNTRANPYAVNWEGIGNGWACASSNHNEPTPKVLLNPDELSIPFGSSDIKALLSYYYAFANDLPPTQHLGTRCGVSTEGCSGDDLSPASFHIVLANRIGIKKESFLADIDPYQEVWNHPFQGYRSEILQTTEAEDMNILTIRTRVSYVNKSVGTSWGPIKGSFRHVNSNRIYTYDLHVNKDGDIVGGEWRSRDRPDFIWVMPVVKQFTGYFSKLGELLD